MQMKQSNPPTLEPIQGKGNLDESKATNKDTPTAAASSGVLTDAMLQEAWHKMPRTDLTETVLVAPNRRIAKEWSKMYPGIKVILAVKYKGYPLPKGYTGVTDLAGSDSDTNTRPSNPQGSPTEVVGA